MTTFTVTKYAKAWAVEGVITVAGVIGAEDLCVFARTKREAEALAAKWERIEADAQRSVHEDAAVRRADVTARWAARNERRAAAPVQLALF